MEDIEVETKARDWLNDIRSKPYSFTAEQIDYIESEYVVYVKSLTNNEEEIKKLIPIFREYFN